MKQRNLLSLSAVGAGLLLLQGCQGQAPQKLSDAQIEALTEKIAQKVKADAAPELARLEREITQVREELKRTKAQLAAAASNPDAPRIPPPGSQPKGAEVPPKPPTPAPTPDTPAKPPTPKAKTPPATPEAKPKTTPEAKPEATPTPPPESPAEDTVLAKIGAESVTYADYKRLTDQNPRVARLSPQDVVKNLVQFRLLTQGAEAAGLPKKDPELARTIASRLRQFRHEYMIRDTLAKKPVIDQDQARKYFDAHPEEFAVPESLELSEITLPTEDEAKALVDGELSPENFHAMAREHSISPSKRREGRIGRVTADKLPPQAFQTMKELEPGELAGPYENPSKNWTIFMRGAYHPASTQDFEKVRGEIVAKLNREARDEAVVEIRERAEEIWPRKILVEDPSTIDDEETVLFQLGPRKFRQGDFQAALTAASRANPFAYRSPEQKLEFYQEYQDQLLFSQFAQTDPEFLKDREPFLRDVERQLLINHFAQTEIYPDVEVTEEEIQTFYDTQKERFKTPPSKSLKARHILVRVGQTDSEDKVQAAKAKILQALERIRAGESFSVVAREVSEGPTGPRGGDLGSFGPKQMVPPFDEAVQALGDWEVTQEPVRTRFGFHLILREPTPKYMRFLEVRGPLKKQLETQKQNQRIEETVAELQAKAEIVYYPENYPKPPGSNSIVPPGIAPPGRF